MSILLPSLGSSWNGWQSMIWKPFPSQGEPLIEIDETVIGRLPLLRAVISRFTVIKGTGYILCNSSSDSSKLSLTSTSSTPSGFLIFMLLSLGGDVGCGALIRPHS